ncbi:hypothetical protein [Pedobacter nototheniae]|uniref:hypothetical protein n=1 Tax=Pedobacter nototheniae TaxID=2488994 RepID=UPI0029308E69|nr:hypothetical protein [Pedobacter nototheniae]
MRVPVTLLLLFSIATGILIFYAQGEHPSETAPYFTVPIVIEVLLIFIFFFSNKHTTYRKVFKIVLIIWSVIFVFCMLGLIYLTSLAGAFLH